MLKAKSIDHDAITVGQTVLLFLCFVAVVIAIVVAKKIYYRLRHKKRYYIFPRISVKGIANIAMVISIAVVILLLLTVLTAGLLGIIFRAYPGWRITIESILIKIGGLLFGPIIGMFIGAVTDILCIALTAGMFHYGFFIAAIGYGLLAGIVREILNWNRNRQFWFALCSTILIFVCLIACGVFLEYSSPANGYVITLLNRDFTFEWWKLFLIIFGICALWLTILWVCMAIFYRPQMAYSWAHLTYWIFAKHRINQYRQRLINAKDKQKISDKQLSWYARNHEKINKLKFNSNQKLIAITKRKDSWITYFCPVLIVVMLCELLINVFILPIFDQSLSGGIHYETWLGTRIFLTIFTIPLGILIIFPVYRIVAPTMHYNYKNDVVEGISVPLVMD